MLDFCGINCGCFIPFLFNFCEDLGLVGLCFKRDLTDECKRKGMMFWAISVRCVTNGLSNMYLDNIIVFELNQIRN